MTRSNGGTNCRQVRDLLPLYADGELESKKQAQVAEHLQGCPACRERLDTDIKLAAELAAYAPAAAAAATHLKLRSRVMAEIDQERRRQPIRRAALRLGNAASWVVVSGIAAALVLGIGITARPLAERAWRGQAPASAPTAAANPSAGAPEFGPARDLFTPTPSAGFFSVSPDGQWVLYPVPGRKTDDGSTVKPHLEAYKMSSGEVVTLEIATAEGNLSGEGQYTWFPDSQRLLVTTSGDGGQILVKPLGAQAAQLLARAPQGSLGFGEAAISPDGWRIAYTVIYPAGSAPVPKIGIEVINADGSSSHRQVVVEPDYFVGKLAWTPDGSQLVFFKGKGGTPPEDGEAYFVGADNVPAPALPQPIMDNARLAAWSPSGTQALWLSEPPYTLGRADLYLSAWPIAGEPQLVASGVGMAGAAWAGSDEWFVYGKDGALYLAQNGGREQLVRLTPEGEVADAPRWVPGHGLIYRVARHGRASLRLLPLKSSEPVAPVAPPVPTPQVPVVAPTATPVAVVEAGSFKALQMVDARTGWALAERGILRTADGGATWADVTPQGIATPKEGGSLYWGGQHCLDADHAWVGVGVDGSLTLLRTADGGRSWQAAPLPVPGMGAHLTFIDAQRGWALLGQGAAAGSEAVAVLGTQDGGATWAVLSTVDPQNPQPGQLPLGGIKTGIAFADAANGWVGVYQPVSGKVLLYASRDGGRSWAAQAPALPAGYEDAQAMPQAPIFFNAQEGVLAVGLQGHNSATLFYSTRDGGATWSATTPVSTATGGQIVADWLSVEEGWALVVPPPGADKPELRHTADGARSWTTLSTDPALANALDLQFVDSALGWALCAGEQGTYVLKTTDGGRTWGRG